MGLGHRDVQMAFNPQGTTLSYRYEDRRAAECVDEQVGMPYMSDTYGVYQSCANDESVAKRGGPTHFGGKPSTPGPYPTFMAPARPMSRHDVDSRDPMTHFGGEISRQRMQGDVVRVDDNRKHGEFDVRSHEHPTSVAKMAQTEPPQNAEDVQREMDVQQATYRETMENGQQLQKVRIVPSPELKSDKQLYTAPGRRTVNLRKGTKNVSIWKKILARAPLATPAQPVLSRVLELKQGHKLESPSRSVKTFRRLLTGSSKSIESQKGSLVIGKPKTTKMDYSVTMEPRSWSSTPQSCSDASQMRVGETRRQQEEFIVDTSDSLPSHQHSPWRQNVLDPEVSGPLAAATHNSSWDPMESQNHCAIHSPEKQQMLRTMPENLMFGNAQQESPLATGNTKWDTPERQRGDQSRQMLLTTMPDHIMFATNRERDSSSPSQLLASNPADFFDEFDGQNARLVPEHSMRHWRNSAWKMIRVNVVIEVLNDVPDTELMPYPTASAKDRNHGSSCRLAVSPRSPLTVGSAEPLSQNCSSPLLIKCAEGPVPAHQHTLSQHSPSPVLSNPLASPGRQVSEPVQQGFATIHEPNCKRTLAGPQGDIPFSLDSFHSQECLGNVQGPVALGFSALDFYEEHPAVNAGGWAVEERNRQADTQGGYQAWPPHGEPTDSRGFGKMVLGSVVKECQEPQHWSTVGYAALAHEHQVRNKLEGHYDSISKENNMQLKTAAHRQYPKDGRFKETTSRADVHFGDPYSFGLPHKSGLWEERQELGETRPAELLWDNENTEEASAATYTYSATSVDFEGPRLKLEGSFNSYVPVYSGERVWSLSEVKRLSGVWMKDLKASDDPGQLCDFLELGWIFQKAITNSRHLEIDVTDDWVRMKARLFGLFEQTEQLAWDSSGCLVPRRDLRTGFTHVWLERTPGGFRQWSQWGEPVAGEKVEDYRLSQDSQTLTVYAHLVRQMGQVLNLRTVFRRVPAVRYATTR